MSTRRYKVDRWFNGVRINRASGATTAAEHRKRDAFLTWLDDTSRLDILGGIATGRLTIKEAYAAHCAGKLAFAVNEVVLDRPLWDAVRQWLPGSAKAPGTRDHYEKALRSLQRYAAQDLPPAARIRDLALVDWQAVYNRWPAGPVSWNRMRGALSRFLTMMVGDKWDPFRRGVISRMPHAEEGEGRVPDLPVDRFWEILDHVPESLRPLYVLMVATGVEPGLMETARLLPHSQSLAVTGAKKGRQGETTIPLSPEIWEWARAAVPCPFTRDYLYRQWKKACRAAGSGELTLYALRHCYGQWLVNAGVPQSVVQVGMRHKTAAMTARYVRQRDRGVNAQAITAVLFGGPESPARSPAGAGRLRIVNGA